MARRGQLVALRVCRGAQMPESPPASRFRRPSWLDLRLVSGMLLVLVSVLVGARVLASADQSVQVWAVRADLAAGTTLSAGDVLTVRGQLHDPAGSYPPASAPPPGRPVLRPPSPREPLPRTRPAGTPR